MNAKGLKAVALAMTTVMFFSGCATPGGQSSSGQTSSSEDGGCNPAAMALLGALAGAALNRNNRSAGAAIGGAVGGLACVAWNYRVKQLQTAEQINARYKLANNGALPSQARVVSYEARPAPSTTFSAGTPVVINSVIGVVDGSDGKKPVIEQELVVTHAGQVVSRSRKIANLNQGAGQYQTDFTVKLPQGVPQGSYPVQTIVYLNGTPVQRKDLSFQVV